MQAITEAGEDPEIRRFVRRHMRQVHDYVADILRRAQAAGGVAQDRDPEAEAWIFLGGTLLLSVADRLGGLMRPEDFEAIRRERGRWLAGQDADLECRRSRHTTSEARRNADRSTTLERPEAGLAGREAKRAVLWRARKKGARGGNMVSPAQKRNVPGCGSRGRFKEVTRFRGSGSKTWLCGPVTSPMPLA